MSVLLLYHRPTEYWYKDASTVEEHIRAFPRHSRFPVVTVNTHLGYPRGLGRKHFDALLLHYSLFGSGIYMLDKGFQHFVRESDAYKVAFFQDEYFFCQKRFRFIDDYGIDCVYTCLEPPEFDNVYGRYTNVSTIRSNYPGYASEDMVAAAGRFAKPFEERAIDVGYRGRPLPPYMGRGALPLSAAMRRTSLGGPCGTAWRTFR